MSLADGDIERNMVVSPAALGVVTKATAEEVRAVERHTESEFGRYAEQRDLWLVAVVERCLAAYVASFYDPGDSEGAEQHVDAKGMEVETEEPDGDGDKPAFGDDVPDEEATEEGPSEQPEEEEEHPLTDPEEGREDAELARAPAELLIRLPDGELVSVQAEHLDSDFVIGFAEAGRTPMADAELRDNLVNLMDTIMGLYEGMQKPGPMGIMAEEMLRTLHDKFELPPNLHPDYLKNRQREEGVMEEQPVPSDEAAAPSPDDPFAAVAQMPPEQALATMEQAFADQPDLLQMVQRAKTLPPEAQEEAIRIILDTIKGGGQDADLRL